MTEINTILNLEFRLNNLEKEFVNIKDILLNIESLLQKSEEKVEEVHEEDLTNYSKDELKYFKDIHGNEEWVDSKGNSIQFKNSDGLIIWREYNENCIVIHEKRSTGYEVWRSYNDNIFHYKWSDGSEEWWDENSRTTIGKKSPKGNETWFDSIGRIIRTKYLGDEAFYEYDVNDQLLSIKYSNGLEVLWERNTEGIITYKKDVDGNEEWFNDRGFITHTKYPTGLEKWWEYDANGNATYYKDSDGTEEWYNKDINTTHDENSSDLESLLNITSKIESDGKEIFYDSNGKQIEVKTTISPSI